MRRVEKVVGEARTLRVLRAARAQEPSLLPPSSLSDDEEWGRDCEVAARILDDLAERPLPDGSVPADRDGFVDGRRGRPLAVFDPAVLTPFVDAVRLAIVDVVAKVDPVRLVMDSMEPSILALVGVEPTSQYATSNPGRARRAAIEDACVLAWEMSLFEALRRVHLDNDASRPFNRHADFSGISVEDGVVRRGGRIKAEAARRRSKRAKSQVAKSQVSKSQEPDLQRLEAKAPGDAPVKGASGKGPSKEGPSGKEASGLQASTGAAT